MMLRCPRYRRIPISNMLTCGRKSYLEISGTRQPTDYPTDLVIIDRNNT